MKIVGSAPERQVHALIAIPSWDGKLGLASLFVIGYYALVIIMLLGKDELPQTKADIVRDAMLTLGPPIGIIIGALFRQTAAEERREALRSTELTTAITTPGAPAADTAGQVENGARKGARDGVAAGLDAAGDPWEARRDG